MYQHLLTVNNYVVHCCFIVAVVLSRCRISFAQVAISEPANKTSSVNEGGRLTIVCSSPLGGVVEWLHNDRPIGASLDPQRYVIRNATIGNVTRHYLTVSDVRTQDAGLYTCQQTFADDRNINVRRLEKLLITDPPEISIALDTGDNMTLTCVGDNAAVIAWYLSGQLVTLSKQRDDDITFERNPETNRQTAQLTRRHMTSHESGEYQCRDQTKHLADSRDVIVRVTSMSELVVSNTGCHQLLALSLQLVATIVSTFWSSLT